MKEYEILRKQVPLETIDKALRVMHLDLLNKGISKRELDWWSFHSQWFGYDIWNSKELEQIKEFLPKECMSSKPTGTQIILTFPEEGTEKFNPHLDEVPEKGQRYKSIVGVALSPWTKQNGSIELHTTQGLVVPELDAGDVLIMSPDLWHTRGRNQSGNIRYSVYFRWLEEST